ncbi:MAG: hypothetical protein COT15_01560 [Candidatus Diapherotrites archaeon CG08_land_8_20_14_0_20_34_12]|nr:MAG: hypothetical protein COT15_01560 [Candidatus Diapherotrites archaeon CG08_land_8_20_14_0_20_34_12]
MPQRTSARKPVARNPKRGISLRRSTDRSARRRKLLTAVAHIEADLEEEFPSIKNTPVFDRIVAITLSPHFFRTERETALIGAFNEAIYSMGTSAERANALETINRSAGQALGRRMPLKGKPEKDLPRRSNPERNYPKLAKGVKSEAHKERRRTDSLVNGILSGIKKAVIGLEFEKDFPSLKETEFPGRISAITASAHMSPYERCLSGIAAFQESIYFMKNPKEVNNALGTISNLSVLAKQLELVERKAPRRRNP